MDVKDRKRAVIYARVSTDEQKRKLTSVPAQISVCTRYCQERGLKIDKIYVDEGYSGKSMNRPNMLQLIKDSENKLFDVLVVVKQDRLSRRSADTTNFIEYGLWKRNQDFIAIEDNIITFDKDQRENQLDQIEFKGLQAGMERRNVIRHTRRAVTELTLKGKYTTRPPYGYRVNKGIIKVHQKEADEVVKIFDLWNSGRSFKEIKELIPHIYQKKLYRILRNPIYMGKKTIRNIDISDKIQAIINEETFRKANSKIQNRGKRDLSR